MPFNALGLLPELTRALADRQYTEPTPVQARVIPEILAGRDILAGAQTGTGKTAGFTLPLLQRLNQTPSSSRAPRAVVLVPTRELAAQVGESVKSYGKYLKLRTLIIFGGVSINPQIDALRQGADILVATPGRLLDHAQQRNVDLRQVQMFVLDEADRMLDMGFIADIRRVIKLLPQQRQNLMFSATYSDDIRRLAQGLLRNPVEIEVARRNAAVELVEQGAYFIPKDRKRALLSHLILEGDWSQVLIFTRTKHGANRLAKQLEDDGIAAAAIHGNKSQGQRTAAIQGFRSGSIRVLIATDIAARGIDIPGVSHVFNYEIPNVPEDYVHRIGRTGRAGATGIAVSLVAQDESGLLKDIERLLGKRITQLAVPQISEPLVRRSEPETEQNRERSHDSRPRAHGSQSGNRSGSQRNAHSHARNDHGARPARDQQRSGAGQHVNGSRPQGSQGGQSRTGDSRRTGSAGGGQRRSFNQGRR
jgi:ATP-dependent RNA helicase RhlE